MEYSKNGLSLTESFEGLRLDAYRDLAGVLTIGYGHTGPDVHEGMTITQEGAEVLLLKDVATAVATVNRCVKVALTQNQFDALVDFTYNAGGGAFTGSTLLRLLNASNYTGAAGQFEEWVHAGGKVVAGLVRRRLAERSLFEGA